MASVRQSPTPLDRLLMDFPLLMLLLLAGLTLLESSPVSPMDMVLDMEDTDILVATMARERLMLMPTPLDRLLMVFTVVLSPVSPMAMVLDMEDTDILVDTMARGRLILMPTPLDRLLMDFTVVLLPVSLMDMVLDMEDMDMVLDMEDMDILVDTMVRGRLMLMPTPLDRLLMDFTVVLSPVSLMAMVLDTEDMDTLVDTMARGRLMLMPTPFDRLLLVLPLVMPMLLDTPQCWSCHRCLLWTWSWIWICWPSLWINLKVIQLVKKNRACNLITTIKKNH